MPCIKCGKDVAGKDVFCQECLEQMADYPVKPGTPVVIPHHTSVRRHQPRKPRAPEPEEVIRRQKRLIRLLSISFFVVLVVWAITIAMLLHMMFEKNVPPIGQNFGFTTSELGNH